MAPDERRSQAELLAAAYALDGPEANRALYADWADTYESGFVVGTGYLYPDRVAAVFATHCASGLGVDDAVVDIGCGTGLAGLALRRRRSLTIDGLDLSPEMLDQAAAKRHDDSPVYRHLIEADLTRPLPIEAGSYAGALSVGTFTHGHVGPASMDHVLPLLRSGGRAAIGINAAHYADADFGAAFDRLVAAGRIADLASVDVPIYGDADMDDRDRYAHVVIFTAV